MISVRRPTTNTTRLLSKKTIILALCCLYAISFLSSRDRKKSTSLRATVNSNTSINNEDITNVDKQHIQQEFNTVMNDIKDSANEESEVTMGWLHTKIIEAQIYIHRAIDTMILSEDNLSEEDVQNIDEQVSEGVEEQLKSELQSLIEKSIQKIEEELKNVENEEIKSKSTKDIDGDIESIRSYYIDKMEDDIDTLEHEVEGKIHDVTEEVEKTLLKKSLGLEISTEDLEDEEVNSVILEVEDEVLDNANDIALNMEEEVDTIETNLEKEIQTSLNDFLIQTKHLSPTQAKEVQEKILSGLEDEISSLVQKEETDLENITNEELDRFDTDVLENAMVISQAKELGMKSTLVDNNVAQVMEPKLATLKKELEEYLKGAIEDSKERIIESLSQVTRDVEMKTFEEDGIDISEEEMADLVERETRKIVNKPLE